MSCTFGRHVEVLNSLLNTITILISYLKTKKTTVWPHKDLITEGLFIRGSYWKKPKYLSKVNG